MEHEDGGRAQTRTAVGSIVFVRASTIESSDGAFQARTGGWNAPHQEITWMMMSFRSLSSFRLLRVSSFRLLRSVNDDGNGPDGHLLCLLCRASRCTGSPVATWHVLGGTDGTKQASGCGFVPPDGQVSSSFTVASA